MNLFTRLRQEWHATEPKRLLVQPPTVLRAVDEPRAAALREVLGVESLGDMATQPLVDWVWRTYSLFRAGVQSELPEDAAEHVVEEWRTRSCGEWLASPLSSLSGLDEAQVQRLEDALGWVTVRHMASDEAFATAREVSRIVTGKPVPPEETVTKPLPDYFGGGTQRFLERQREAGAEVRAAVPPPPPPPPPAPERAPQAQAVEAPAQLPAEGDAPPAMAAALQPGSASALPQGPRRHAKDYTPEGMYIPKGGGLRGWVDNQGVARVERPNRYRYHEMVDVQRFRRSELEETVRVNNRGAERKDVRMQVRWSLDGATHTPGLCLNLSITGARLRVGQALREGTTVEVVWVHRDDLLGQEQPILVLSGQVVWCQSVNPAYRTQRYDCGIQFDAMELDAQERLTLLLTDRVDALLEAGPPQASAAL